jgi:excisionase family DNA binding protein
MSQVPPISATQASAQTGIPKRTILWAISQGNLRATKLGDGTTSAYLIHPADLDEWVAKREQATA